MNNIIKDRLIEATKFKLIYKDINQFFKCIKSAMSSITLFIDFERIKFTLDCKRFKFESKFDFDIKFFKKIKIKTKYKLQSELVISQLIDAIFKKYQNGMDQYVMRSKAKLKQSAIRKVNEMIKYLRNNNGKIKKMPSNKSNKQPKINTDNAEFKDELNYQNFRKSDRKQTKIRIKMMTINKKLKIKIKINNSCRSNNNGNGGRGGSGSGSGSSSGSGRGNGKGKGKGYGQLEKMDPLPRIVRKLQNIWN